MKKNKTIKANIINKGYSKGRFTNQKFEDQRIAEEQKRIKKETQIVNIAGGIIGIAALIFAGFAYGIELPVILFVIVLSNNLCNVK